MTSIGCLMALTLLGSLAWKSLKHRECQRFLEGHQGFVSDLCAITYALGRFSAEGTESTIYHAVLRNVVPHEPGELNMGDSVAAGVPVSSTRPNATLRSIMEGTAGAKGDHFFLSLVQYLAASLKVKASFVGEFNPERTKVLTLAVWVANEHVPNFDFGIEGTPCKQVLQGTIQHFC